MTTIEYLADCSACDFTAAHALADVAFLQLRAHNESVHADTATGRIIPFIIDVKPDPILDPHFQEHFMKGWRAAGRPLGED